MPPATTTSSQESSLYNWVTSTHSEPSYFLKGLLLGIAAGLLLAASTCCWLPCLHYAYAEAHEQLHDFHFGSAHVRLRPHGGFSAYARRRLRLFFMGSEESAAVVGGPVDAGIAGGRVANQTGPGGDGDQAHEEGQPYVLMQPAFRHVEPQTSTAPVRVRDADDPHAPYDPARVRVIHDGEGHVGEDGRYYPWPYRLTPFIAPVTM
ncbi:hypothetical protein Cob_v008284 [Colletotrichum orbiculare MAFF 240422]|uniref:Uncharacterized protein n=1 Tax=Colletotrichum orbiculare (strain 104-T / ATCC 96160 / CBS 514.97 / LARS 414 / MAFF 240422) TaxID=1213857 RepID=A0A484FMZ6_COLOR|nr:hypothetical protein Cob_v008284 [Colletotrichum orbiculare MAFF 240422]